MFTDVCDIYIVGGQVAFKKWSTEICWLLKILFMIEFESASTNLQFHYHVLFFLLSVITI